MSNNSKQRKGKRKSLPKETCIKTINGERHGAVAGNASASNLNQSGSERLNHFALTHSDSAAKLKQKTETTKKKVQILSIMVMVTAEILRTTRILRQAQEPYKKERRLL